jgi:hypothetical protein
MNPIPTQQSLQDAELDHILLTHMNAATEQLTPSSGFTQSVMDAIREQATAPPPIPFPWKRLLPAAIALLGTLLVFAVFAGRQASPLTGAFSSVSFDFAVYTTAATRLGWIAAAICLSLATATISFKLAAGRR